MKKLNLIAFTALLMVLLVVPASLSADDYSGTTASDQAMYSDGTGSGDTVGLQFDTRPVGSRYWMNSKNAWSDNDRMLRINPYGVLYQDIEGLQARTPEPAPVYNPDNSMVGMNPYQKAEDTMLQEKARFSAAYENHKFLRTNPYGALYQDVELMQAKNRMEGDYRPDFSKDKPGLDPDPSILPMNPWGSRLPERLKGEDAWHLNARFLRMNPYAHVYKDVYAMQIEKGAYSGINAETLQNQTNP